MPDISLANIEAVYTQLATGIRILPAQALILPPFVGQEREPGKFREYSSLTCHVI